MKKALAFLFLVCVCAVPSFAQVVDSVFVPLSNCELFDTRPFSTAPISPLAPLAAESTTFLKVRGQCNVPADANAVELNVVILNPSTVGRAKILESSLPNTSAFASVYWSGLFTSQNLTVRLCYPAEECSTEDTQIWVSAKTDMLIRVAGYYRPAP